ncbi:hypothetical protein NMY22_g7599 [Coprinellus aureogranulatus]|nr:hypothetical protein NMY22_g7599 [Coprinellus aureogranulatus]
MPRAGPLHVPQRPNRFSHRLSTLNHHHRVIISVLTELEERRGYGRLSGALKKICPKTDTSTKPRLQEAKEATYRAIEDCRVDFGVDVGLVAQPARLVSHSARTDTSIERGIEAPAETYLPHRRGQKRQYHIVCAEKTVCVGVLYTLGEVLDALAQTPTEVSPRTTTSKLFGWANSGQGPLLAISTVLDMEESESKGMGKEIARQMDDEFIECSAETFVNHYLPFTPADQDVLRLLGDILGTRTVVHLRPRTRFTLETQVKREEHPLALSVSLML